MTLSTCALLFSVWLLSFRSRDFLIVEIKSYVMVMVCRFLFEVYETILNDLRLQSLLKNVTIFTSP